MSGQMHVRDSYRPPFHVENSEETILRFPFPFPEDTYMYSMNVEPHVRGGPVEAMSHTFDVDEHYIGECAEKARILEEDRSRRQVVFSFPWGGTE